MNKVAEIEKQMMRTDLDKFGPGDTLKVSFRVHEGKKDKVQSFQGVCIKIRGAGMNRTFTLRKISQGIGVERIFNYHSPLLEKVEVVRYGKVRRAKLYYLRDKVGKDRQVKERIVAKPKKERKPRSKKAKAKAAALAAEQAKAKAAEAESEAVVEDAKADAPVESAAEAPAPQTEAKEASVKEPAVQTPPKEEKDATNESGSGGMENG